MENVTFNDSIVESETWYPDGTILNIPYDFTYGVSATIGTDIYLFGSGSADSRRYNYKYNRNRRQ